ncbi:MAG: ribokinase [Acidobacteriota bacterium]|jgi:ribokinase
MSDGRIVVVGSANTDMVLQVSRIPAPGETVLGGTFATHQGGKGANQAVAAARAGGRVTFVARVGRDDLGNRSLEGLRDGGVDCKLVTVTDAAPSGVALIFVDETGQNAIGVAPGANGTLTVADLEAAGEALRSARVVLAQLEVPMDCIRHLGARTANAGDRFILNPAPAQPLDEDLLPRVDILVPNESEASLLAGIEVTDRATAESAATALLAKGVGTVIVTRGEAGALIVTPEGSTDVPPYRVHAVDTTAAGDAFCGALAVALAEDRSLMDGVRFASAAAALSVTRPGAQPSLHHRSEIEEFLKAAQ